MSKFRTTVKYNDNEDKWETCNFTDLIPGDVFSLYEPDGMVVKNKDNICTFLATDIPRTIPEQPNNFAIKNVPINIVGKRDICIIKNYSNIDTNLVHRWMDGNPHHVKSIELAKHLKVLDYSFNSNYFDFRFGGDGDNGEQLMFLLDMYFELQDKKESI